MNRARGEVPLVIEGERHQLCLTIGALAEIEESLGLASLGDLEARLKSPSMKDVIAILAALLRGGGHDLDELELGGRQIDLGVAARAIADAFAAAGLAHAP
jgi:hypothetical protein